MLVFLFTDIEGSTQLWEDYTDRMGAVIARHDTILQKLIRTSGGRITKHTGDGVTAVFEGGKPVSCALESQLRFAREGWDPVGELRIRIGLHAGMAEWIPGVEPHSGDYFGPPVNCAARVMSAAWGGQILLTPEVTSIAPIPDQAILKDLGKHLLKNVSNPQHIYQLDHPDLQRREFPPPRTISEQSIRRVIDQQGNQITDLSGVQVVALLVSATLLPAFLRDALSGEMALEDNIEVLKGLGAEALAGFLSGFSQHLQMEKPEEIQQQLEIKLQQQWATNALLRSDASRLLQAVRGPDTALMATTGEIKLALARSFAELGSQFSEFHWMLRDIQDTLLDVHSLQSQQLALQREQLAKTDEILLRQVDQQRAILPALQPEAVPSPVFLKTEEEPFLPQVFVARELELSRLNNFLYLAMAGQGQVVFVTGGPGRGKTAMLAEFAQRAMETMPELLVASGSCNAYSGIGDPYLPFREILDMLTGDVEGRWASGLISSDHARRLWFGLPEAISALLHHGPYIVSLLVSGQGLLARALAAAPEGAPWLQPLEEQITRQMVAADGLEQSQLFQQVTNVLRALAQDKPLLLILDDLQWADTASIGLLFHLGRHIAGSKILLVGAYRPEEVALGRNGDRHPLQKVLTEFKGTFGDIWVDLTETEEVERRAFVDAFLDTEPNRLCEEFREALFQRTGGHPLYTIELLRGMQESGNLLWDEGQGWVEGSTLEWDSLPARVEGVIEERIGRLESSLREILWVASVEGERFTVEVIAPVLKIDVRTILRHLSQLERVHGLVREREEVSIGDNQLSRYQFSHILFQSYLYSSLSKAERRLLHREIGDVLEQLYTSRIDEITVDLAEHFAKAGEDEKAVDYLLQAGDKARRMYAYQEAIEHYDQSLVLLKQHGEYARAARTLMKLGLTYHLILDFQQTRKAYEEGFALWQRAGEIQEGDMLKVAPHALRVSMGTPTTLDPIFADDTFSIAVVEQLFSGLAERTPDMGVVPDVARKWDVIEGGRKYVFHLRGDVQWSDGTPVTARDFEYSWKLAMDPVINSPLASLMDDIKGAKAFYRGEISDLDLVGVRAIDDLTLVVELESPTGYFPHLLTLCKSYPVPQHALEAHGEAWTDTGNFVSNGPFRLVDWQPGKIAILVRNPKYHNLFKGNLQSVHVCLQPDPSTRLALYETDDLDIFHLCDLTAVEMDRARHRHAGEYVSVPTHGTQYVGFNTSQPPFDDPRVRRAFVLATDRDLLANVVLRGTVFPATGGFVPPGMLGHSQGIALPYDPDQARRLMAEAGYPDGREFPLVYWPVVQNRVLLGEGLQIQWRENLGVEINRETLDWGKFIDLLDREPPHIFCLGETADYPDPDSFLRVSSFRRWIQWQDKTYDELVEQARRVTDQQERTELYQAADRILVEDAVIMPFAYGRCHLLVKPWVKKCPTSTTKFWFWKDVIIDPH